MPANQSRIEDIAIRLGVSCSYHFIDVHVIDLAYPRQFISKSYIEVPVGILCYLIYLCHYRTAHTYYSWREAGIDTSNDGCALIVYAPNYLGIRPEVMEHLRRLNTFR